MRGLVHPGPGCSTSISKLGRCYFHIILIKGVLPDDDFLFFGTREATASLHQVKEVQIQQDPLGPRTPTPSLPITQSQRPYNDNMR
jgi:hypothetical protein